jgi:hypothetical protein
LESLVIEESSWDGSDIFWLGAVLLLCFTERVVQALKEAQVTNAQFLRLEDAARDGPLRWRYPERMI